MEHPNVQVYRSLMAAFDARDAERIAEHLAPDIRWHEAGNPQTIEGRDALRSAFAGMEATENDVEVHDVLANDDHVVAMLRVRITAGADSVSYPVVEVAHVKDGLVTERWAFMDACPDGVTEFFAKLRG